MSDGIIKKIQLPNGNIYDIQSKPVIDLGNIDPSEYEDDREVFLNTLLQDGAYRFVWEDGDDYEYYVVVESMLENGYVYQKYWSSEEGSSVINHSTLIVEDGEVVDRSEENYMTLTDASIMFAVKNHAHYESKNAAMSVLDWCDSNALTFDNSKPFILYTDTLNSKNWIIERYATVRQPNYRFIKVYDMSDASHFYIRSGSLVGNSTVWGSWKEYPSNGVTDVLVNNGSVANNGIASISISDVGLSNDYSDLDNLPTIPSKTSDLTNDSGFITGYTETDPTVPAWAKASAKPSYNFSEIGSTPTTISGYGLTDAYTKTEVDNLFLALPEPMIFKGSLGTGGTITTLPTAAATNEGFVYKVITDGTYASQAAKVGDTFISDGSAWVLIPSGDEPSGTVTSVGVSNATNGGLSVSGTPVTSSGTITIGHSNVLTSEQTTSGIYPIKIDKNGHISEYGNAVTIPANTSDLVNNSGFITSPNVVYCTCDTAAGTVAKEATIVSGTLTSLTAGDQAIVKFVNTNTATNPTLNIAGTGAKAIKRYGTTAVGTTNATSWTAGTTFICVYDGTNWALVSWINTAYSEISEANITSSSSSSTGLVSGRRVKKAVETFAPVTSVNGQTGAVTIGSDVFYAEYNVTSFQDVKNAYDAGKTIITFDSRSGTTFYYPLCAYADTGGTEGFAFEKIDADCYYTRLILLDTDVWSTIDGYLPYNNLDGTPINLSEFNNDSGFITSASVPTKISDLTNDSGLMAFNDLVIEEYTKAYSNIAGGGNFSWDESVSKSGYYPVGVVGFNAARAGLCCEFAFITDVVVGSCTIRMHAKNTTSSSIQANTAKIYVLWIKV